MIIIFCAFMIARNATAYTKAETFSYDTAIMMVGLLFLKDGIDIIKNIPSLCKSAAETTAEATSRIKPSEAIESLKGADAITSFDDFLATVKTLLEDEALQYLRTTMKGDADDLARLKKVAGLLEKGSENIGKKLSKAELEAGFEALWREGGVEGALKAIERVRKGGLNSIFKNGKVVVDDIKANPTVFSGKSAEEIAEALMDTGYDVVIRESTQSRSGAKIIKINNSGNGKNISQVQVSPGGGRHGNSPYVKISTTDQGIIKIVDGSAQTYITDGKETATIIFSIE